MVSEEKIKFIITTTDVRYKNGSYNNRRLSKEYCYISSAIDDRVRYSPFYYADGTKVDYLLHIDIINSLIKCGYHTTEYDWQGRRVEHKTLRFVEDHEEYAIAELN